MNAHNYFILSLVSLKFVIVDVAFFSGPPCISVELLLMSNVIFQFYIMFIHVLPSLHDKKIILPIYYFHVISYISFPTKINFTINQLCIQNQSINFKGIG